MKNSFLVCSVYAFALSAMILSHRISNAVVEVLGRQALHPRHTR